MKPLLSAAGISYRELRIDEDDRVRALVESLGVMAAPTLLRVGVDGSTDVAAGMPAVMAVLASSTPKRV